MTKWGSYNIILRSERECMEGPDTFHLSQSLESKATTYLAMRHCTGIEVVHMPEIWQRSGETVNWHNEHCCVKLLKERLGEDFSIVRSMIMQEMCRSAWGMFACVRLRVGTIWYFNHITEIPRSPDAPWQWDKTSVSNRSDGFEGDAYWYSSPNESIGGKSLHWEL